MRYQALDLLFVFYISLLASNLATILCGYVLLTFSPFVAEVLQLSSDIYRLSEERY